MDINVKYNISDAGYAALQGYVIDTMSIVFRDNMEISDKREILNRLHEISHWIILNNSEHSVPFSNVFQLENNMKYIVSIICDNTRDLDFRRQLRQQQQELIKMLTQVPSK